MRDRALRIVALAVPVILARTYLLLVAQQTMAMPSHWVKVVLLAAMLDDQERSLPAIRHTGEFAAGYLAVWLAFSFAATAAQWVLDEAGLLSATMKTSDGFLTGSLLLYAGVYQWNPVKEACLTHCRAPQEFLARHWLRDGPFGTGLRHGLFCLGCCWVLMRCCSSAA